MIKSHQCGGVIFYCVFPLFSRMEYKDQLELKQKEMNGIIQNFFESVQKANHRDERQPSPALEQTTELESIIPSPLINGYRNKCEFTIAFNQEGAPTVGFLHGLFKDGIINVEEPTNCVHVDDISKELCSVLQNYIRNKSKYLPLNRLDRSGLWRLMLVRSLRSGQVLVLIQVNQQSEGFSYEEIKEGLIEILCGSGSSKVTSLFLQVNPTCINLCKRIRFQRITIMDWI